MCRKIGDRQETHVTLHIASFHFEQDNSRSEDKWLVISKEMVYVEAICVINSF